MGLIDLPEEPVVVLKDFTRRRFDLFGRPTKIVCPLCGEITAYSLMAHAEYMDDLGHLALFVMEA